MNTKSTATALGAIRTRSFCNASTNIQAASPDGSISSPATHLLPVVPNRSGNTNKVVKGTGTCLFAGQFSRLTHPNQLQDGVDHVEGDAALLPTQL